jgi:hypothetical protein
MKSEQIQRQIVTHFFYGNREISSNRDRIPFLETRCFEGVDGGYASSREMMIGYYPEEGEQPIRR